MPIDPETDLALLRRAIELARLSRARGDHPERAAHQIEEIELADALGEPIAGIASRIGRTTASVRRILRERRIERLPVPFDHSPPVSADGARFPIRPVPIARSQARFAELARADTPTDAELERSLARALRGTMHLASSFGAGEGSAGDLDACETALRRAVWAKRELVRVSRRIALRAIEERAGAPFERLPGALAVRAHEAGMASLARAAERFDPSKGGRLAAGASLELARALAWLSPVEPGSDDGDAALRDWSAGLIPAQRVLIPPEVIEGAKGADGPLRELIERRYGLVDGIPRTLDELAGESGLTRLATARRVREAVRAVCGEG